MKHKIISGIFCSLLIILLVAPMMSISAPITVMTDSPMNGSTTAMQGPPVEMRINVYEDESVTSNHTDTNYDGYLAYGGVWVGLEDTDGWARSWLKYDLSPIQNDVGILSATLNLYARAEWNASTGMPIGIYYSANDSWTEETITWGNQPDFAASPTDVIDAPLGEDLIQIDNWYQFDVTGDVIASYSGDKMVSLVLKQVEETGHDETWKYFEEKDYSWTNSTFLKITYQSPAAEGLAVEGFTSSPHIDYIQNDTPTFSWEFLGSGSGAAQRDYELEVWDNEFFNDTLLYEDRRGESYTVYDSSTISNIRPFSTDNEMRWQTKYESTMFSQGGLIDKLYFRVSALAGTAVFEDLIINMVNHPTNVDLTDDFDANFGDEEVITVLNRDVYEAHVDNQWLEFDIENNFVLNGLTSLIIEIRFMNNTGSQLISPVTDALSDEATVAYTHGLSAYTAQTADWVYNRTHGLKLEFSSVPVIEFNDMIGNYYPFAADRGEDGRYQQMYNSSLLNETGVIDSLYIPMATLANYSVFENFLVRMVETPHEGALSHTDMDNNFGGMTPTTVIDSSLFTIYNTGRIAILRLQTPFVYTGEHNLLIDFQWDNLVAGGFTVHRSLDEGGYRAYNLTDGTNLAANDTRGIDLHVGFVHSESEVIYDGTALTNATEYFWRVRVCDGTGVWGEWTSQSFKYEVLTSAPEWNGLVFDPNPGITNQEVDVSLTVTYFLGINQVILEIDGSNHSMSAVGDDYSYTWTPTESGNYTYTIYMESTIGTWTTTSGVFQVVDGSLIPGLDNMILFLILIGVLILIVIVVACRGKKKK